MPKLLIINKETATLEEIKLAANCAPTQKGFRIYQAIEFLYFGDSIKEVAKRTSFSAKTIRNWIHRFNNQGVSGLAIRGKSGRPRKIPIEEFKEQYIPIILDPSKASEDNFTGIKFHKYLKNQCKKELCYQTVLNYFNENNLSKVVPRPSVVTKQEKEKREQFVIDFKSLVDKKKEIWFCDEVGFEGDPRPRARWVIKGSKPANGRASEHLRYSAIGSINPATGEQVSLVVSGVDTVVFQVYLDELNKSIDGRKIVLVLDNASWHKVKTLNWHSITPMYLPPYSPDFNPIENLWRFIKINFFSNWYAKDIDQLIKKICSAFQSLTPAQVKQTTNSDYLTA